MTEEMKVLGINLQTSFDPTRSFSIAAFGDVALPDIETTLRGVALAWSHGSFIALPPKVPGAKPNDLGGIQWNIKGKFAREVCERLVKAYEAFGGEIPAGAANHANAARRIAGKRGWIGAPADYVPTVAPERVLEAAAKLSTLESDETEGLRRFVGADVREAFVEGEAE